jgi:hypothetical protein
MRGLVGLSGMGLETLSAAALSGRPLEVDVSHNKLSKIPILPDSVSCLRAVVSPSCAGAPPAPQ